MTKFVLVAFSRLRTVPSPEQREIPADQDPGWFGPDSVAWRVHADVSMLVAGMTAFALQTLHPRAMAGVGDHSAFGGDFFGRVRRTGEFVQGVVYDTAADAEKRCRGRAAHPRTGGGADAGRAALRRQRPGTARLGARHRVHGHRGSQPALRGPSP